MGNQDKKRLNQQQTAAANAVNQNYNSVNPNVANAANQAIGVQQGQRNYISQNYQDYINQTLDRNNLYQNVTANNNGDSGVSGGDGGGGSSAPAATRLGDYTANINKFLAGQGFDPSAYSAQLAKHAQTGGFDPNDLASIRSLFGSLGNTSRLDPFRQSVQNYGG